MRFGERLEHGIGPPVGYRWARLAPSALVHLADARNLAVSLCDVPVEAAVSEVPEAGGELCERCRRGCDELYRGGR
ncbi:MAG: hypothetical protein ACF8PN_05040 [Phycisphaerales bacterium]